jgi:hypothetical protein
LKVFLAQRPSYGDDRAFFGFAGAIAPENPKNLDVLGERLEVRLLLVLWFPVADVVLLALLLL